MKEELFMKELTKNQKFIYIYLLILPFIDVITSIFVRFEISSFTPGMIIKGLTILYIVYYILFKTKNKIKKPSLIYLGLIVLFFIGYILFKFNIFTKSSIFSELKYALRYFYYPIIFIGVINIFSDQKVGKEIIKKVITINALTYSALLLIPYLTGFSFNSYDNTSFSGSVGLFYAANEISAIMSALGISIYFLLEKNSIKYLLLCLPIIFSTTIIGTKVSLLGIIISTIISVLFYIFKEKNVKSILYSLIIVGALVSFVAISPAKHNYESLEDMHDSSSNVSEKTEEDKIYKYRSIYDFTDNKQIAKFIRTITNGRDGALFKNYSIFLTSNTSDKLFGLSWTTRENINYITDRKLIEIDIMDILFHYGMIGFIIYFLPLLYIIFLLFKNIKKLSLDSIVYILTIFLLLGISLMAGHVFSSPSVTIFLVLFMMLFIYEVKGKVKQNG